MAVEDPHPLAVEARRLEIPALVFRSGASDFNHTRATSEQLASLLPGARLAEPPWGDSEWNERSAARHATSLTSALSAATYIERSTAKG